MTNPGKDEMAANEQSMDPSPFQITLIVGFTVILLLSVRSCLRADEDRISDFVEEHGYRVEGVEWGHSAGCEDVDPSGYPNPLPEEEYLVTAINRSGQAVRLRVCCLFQSTSDCDISEL